MTTYGRFRMRRGRQGALEIWARGWRLELRVIALAPLALAATFLISPVDAVLKGLGVASLLACTWVCARLGKLGFRLTAEGVEVVDVLRTRVVPWDDVVGFVGERDPHEGRAVLLGRDGRRVKAPGTFAAEDMDPYGDEADEPIIDELNRLVWAARRGEALPV
jgi:Bacterial PH domain